MEGTKGQLGLLPLVYSPQGTLEDSKGKVCRQIQQMLLPRNLSAHMSKARTSLSRCSHSGGCCREAQ